jgi:diacylglycerol kinase
MLINEYHVRGLLHAINHQELLMKIVMMMVLLLLLLWFLQAAPMATSGLTKARAGMWLR